MMMVLHLRGVSTKLNKYIVFTMQTYKAGPSIMGGGMEGTRPPLYLDWGGRISNCPPPPFFHMFNEI